MQGAATQGDAAVSSRSGNAADGPAPPPRIAVLAPLALELAPAGIRVNAVLPGGVETDMLRAPRLRPGESLSESELAQRVESQLAGLAALHPLGRLGRPEEIAEVVVATLIDGIRKRGLDCLPWSAAARSLLGRVRCIHHHDPDAAPDTRCYRVDCNRISRFLHGFKPQWTARRGAEQLYESFCQVGLTLDDFEGERFKRIAHVKHLVANGRLDGKLRWTDRQRKAG